MYPEPLFYFSRLLCFLPILQEKLRHILGQTGNHRCHENQLLAFSGTHPLCGLYLLDEGTGHLSVLADKVAVQKADGLLAVVAGEHSLNIRDAQALFQNTDDDEGSQVHLTILFLHRRRHHLQPDIVIDDTGGDGFVLLPPAEGPQILPQQQNHLVHIQPQLRQALPVRQIEVPPALLPGSQPLGHIAFICHLFSALPFLFSPV